MTESAGRVVTPCPACGFETGHAVLSDGDLATVRCTDCGHTHKADVSGPDRVETDVVVSQDGDAFATTTDVPATEELAVGEEFVLDTPDAVMVVRITSLAVGDEQRRDTATAADVETIWTRAVGNVSVDVTVHPTDGGAQPESHSVTAYVPGEESFVVGEERDVAGETVTVEGIVIRDDAHGYPTRTLDRDGDAAPAKDCQRVYARAPDPGGTGWGW